MSGCISSGSGLKLDNERDQVFVQPLPCDTCIARHACSADGAYIALNRLRSAAQILNIRTPKDSRRLLYKRSGLPPMCSIAGVVKIIPLKMTLAYFRCEFLLDEFTPR